MTIAGPESCLWNITLSYSQLMIARSEVYLRKTSGTLNLIEKIINSRKWILILDSNLIQLTVIYTHSNRTIFFLTNKTRAPQGKTLGRMKPFSRRSFNCSFNSFNSDGAIIYSRIWIGRVSGSLPIPKSSLLGGTLGRSSGKTSGKRP